MGRRKGEDSIASRKRRMPYVAKIKRDDSFCPEDEREVEAMCRRIAAAGEFMAIPAVRSAIAVCTSIEQRTAFTTLGNSSNKPSPVVLTILPPWLAIAGSTTSCRRAFSAARVPLSSSASTVER